MNQEGWLPGICLWLRVYKLKWGEDDYEMRSQDVLHGERAEYGKQIISTLARQLTKEYGIQRPDGTLSPLAGKKRNRTR